MRELKSNMPRCESKAAQPVRARDIPMLSGCFRDNFRIKRLGAPPPVKVLSYHRHDFFEIFWIMRGSGVHYRDFQSHKVEAGTLIFICPGQVHTSQWSTQPHGYVITFSTNIFATRRPLPREVLGLPFLPPNASGPCIAVPMERQDHITGLFEELINEFQNQRPHREHTLGALLELLLIECSRGMESSAKPPHAGPSLAARVTNEFTLRVDEHFTKKHLAQDYARMLRISPQSLSRCVRGHTGRTPTYLIEQRLLLEAWRLLLHSSLTVAEIAYQLGFKSPANFGRFFKKLAKTSPGAARRQAIDDA